MTTYSLMDGAGGRPGVGSSGTQPPSAGTSYSGGYIAGLIFNVTQGGMWLQGYRWWVASSTQDTTAMKFALWNLYNASGSGGANNIPAGTITSGTLTAGQFNTVTLSSPVALTPNMPYIAAVGGTLSHGFPLTQNQFGSGNPYASGITNGPLTAYSSSGGSLPINTFPQQPYTTAGSDPSSTFPNQNDANDLLWIDVIVTDQIPSGVSYRAWPNLTTPYSVSGLNSTDQTGYTLAFQFSLTQACTLDRIWHYSSSAATVFPSHCLIWDVVSQTAVSGTDNSSPSWHDPGGGAATPGDGWVYCDYTSSGVTLNASQQYKVSTYHAAGANWFSADGSVFGPGDIEGSGFTNGPLVIPNNAGSDVGQQAWRIASFGYPNTSSNPEADFIDVEVSLPVSPSVPSAYTAFMSSM